MAFVVGSHQAHSEIIYPAHHLSHRNKRKKERIFILWQLARAASHNLGSLGIRVRQPGLFGCCLVVVSSQSSPFKFAIMWPVHIVPQETALTTGGRQRCYVCFDSGGDGTGDNRTCIKHQAAGFFFFCLLFFFCKLKAPEILPREMEYITFLSSVATLECVSRRGGTSTHGESRIQIPIHPRRNNGAVPSRQRGPLQKASRRLQDPCGRQKDRRRQ